MAGVGPARKGRRVVLQERPTTVDTDGDGPHLYVCGPKPLRVGADVLHEGVEVPGAADWLRLESWVGCRRVRRIKATEEHTAYTDFVAARSPV
jgi:hypothetical protein